MNGNIFSPKLNKLAHIGFMAFGGALCGLFILIVSGFSTTWAAFVFGGLIVILVALLSGNLKNFMLLSICFIIPMNAQKNIGGLMGIGPVQDLSITLVNIVTILLYILWIYEIAGNKDRMVHFFPEITIPALAFIGICIVSAVISDQGNSMSLSPVIRMTLDVLLYFYVANNLSSTKMVRKVVWIFLFAALIQCGLATLEIVTNTEFDLIFKGKSYETMLENVGGSKYARISGTLAHPNILAAYLGSIILLLISLSYCETRLLRKLGYYLGIGLGFFVIVNTFSRGMWFGLGVMAPLTILKYMWKSDNKKQTLSFLLIAGFVIAILVVPLWGRVMDRLVVDLSVSSRPMMMQVAFNMIKDNPYFGVGLGNYMTKMFIYDETTMGITSIFPAPVHNAYMLIAAETGIVGLIIFISFIAAIFFLGWQFVKSDSSFLNNAGLGFFSLIVMFLLFFGMTNWIAQTEYIFLFFPLGVLVAIRKILNNTASARTGLSD